MSDNKTDLRDLFGLDGGEFMNTGLTLTEWLTTRDLKKIADSYVQQTRTEQRRRLHYVIQLAAEGKRIREMERFGSVVLESAVENVMEGNWEYVLHDIEWCTFKDALVPKNDHRSSYSDTMLKEFEQQEEHYAKLWTPFRELLEQAYATREEQGQSSTRH